MCLGCETVGLARRASRLGGRRCLGRRSVVQWWRGRWGLVGPAPLGSALGGAVVAAGVGGWAAPLGSALGGAVVARALGVWQRGRVTVGMAPPWSVCLGVVAARGGRFGP